MKEHFETLSPFSLSFSTLSEDSSSRLQSLRQARETCGSEHQVCVFSHSDSALTHSVLEEQVTGCQSSAF